jgi:uncharacterized protein YceH (UPF0502 family)
MHLFSGDAPPATESAADAAPTSTTPGAASLAERIATLEADVAELRLEIASLKDRP